MKSITIKLVTLLALGLLLVGISVAQDTTAKFKVTGMYCDACKAKIEQSLSKTVGVKSAEVDLRKGSAIVVYDDAKVTPQQLAKTIEHEGYKAELERK